MHNNLYPAYYNLRKNKPTVDQTTDVSAGTFADYSLVAAHCRICLPIRIRIHIRFRFRFPSFYCSSFCRPPLNLQLQVGQLKWTRLEVEVEELLSFLCLWRPILQFRQQQLSLSLSLSLPLTSSENAKTSGYLSASAIISFTMGIHQLLTKHTQKQRQRQTYTCNSLHIRTNAGLQIWIWIQIRIQIQIQIQIQIRTHNVQLKHRNRHCVSGLEDSGSFAGFIVSK